jgi:hypothetical protein
MVRKAAFVLALIIVLALPVNCQAQRKKVADKKFWSVMLASGAAALFNGITAINNQRKCPLSCVEKNPLLGRHPTVGRVVAVGLSFEVLKGGTSYLIKRKYGDRSPWFAPQLVSVPMNIAAGFREISEPVDTRPRLCPANGAGCP